MISPLLQSTSTAAHASAPLTEDERTLLRAATKTPFGPKPRNVREGVAHLLDPANRAIEAQAYSREVRHHVLFAVMHGTLMLDQLPEAWSADDWVAVRRAHGQSCRASLIAVAAHGYGIMPGLNYHTGDDTRRVRIAADLFGREVVQAECTRVRASLARMGYSADADASKARIAALNRCVADLLLHHASPSLDVITDASLAAYAGQVAAIPMGRAISTVNSALVDLGIVTRRITYFRPRDRVNQWKRLGVEEEWLGWCKRWQAASTVSERTRRTTFGDLMTAGRWLKRDRSHVTSPEEWTLDLAFEFVRFIDGMKVGEMLAAPRPNLAMGQPLKPTSKASILSGLRRFFRDLQQWHWIEGRFSPDRGFAIPRQVERSLKHNPRPIDDGHWLKLRSAALALTSADLPRTHKPGWSYSYPIEMVRALAAAWVFSECRSDEIERLEVGCAYIEHVPAQSAEAAPAFDQPMLRVPVSKTRGEFVKPVEEPLLRTLLAWQAVRPTQPMLKDATTGRMVHHVFCFRGRRVGHGILNYVIIPILLRKAGLPASDSRGVITSHRARATMATKLYNSESGLGPLEVMNWLGHTHFSSTQYYLALTPVRLMTAFHKSAKLTEHLRCVSVLVDSQPGPGDPVFRYDLGHGFCTNPAYSACAHRMACARCDFYEPAESFEPTLVHQAGRYIQMLQQLDLSEDERAATTGDREAVELLLKRLHHEPAPGQQHNRAAPASQGEL